MRRLGLILLAIVALAAAGCGHTRSFRAEDLSVQPIYVGQDVAGRPVVASKIERHESESDDHTPPKVSPVGGFLAAAGAALAGLGVLWFFFPTVVVGALAWIFYRGRQQFKTALEETAAGVERAKILLAGTPHKETLKAALADSQGPATKDLIKEMRGVAG